MTAAILDFAKLKAQITDKNEKAGRAVWEYGLRMLKNGMKPKQAGK